MFFRLQKLLHLWAQCWVPLFIKSFQEEWQGIQTQLLSNDSACRLAHSTNNWFLICCGSGRWIILAGWALCVTSYVAILRSYHLIAHMGMSKLALRCFLLCWLSSNISQVSSMNTQSPKNRKQKLLGHWVSQPPIATSREEGRERCAPSLHG